MKKWRLVIIILIVATALSLLSAFGVLKGPKNVFWNLTKPISLALKASFGRVPNFFINITHVNQILKQNRNLINENLELQSQLNSLKEVTYENEILKKELNFSQVQNKATQLVPVAIIGRTSGYLKSVVVDKGNDNGLVKGQAVVSQGFLVGIVNSVTENSAEVTLVTDYKSLVPAVLQDSRGTGLLRGGLGGLIIEDIPLNIEIKTGENIVTSGLGGQVPSGISVGKAQGIISKPGEIFQKVSVDSPIDFSRLEVLFVVKK